jgi:hypothetical protein
MSNNDISHAITFSNLPYRLRTDGWWLEENCEIRPAGIRRAAPRLVLIKGQQQKEDGQGPQPRNSSGSCG